MQLALDAAFFFDCKCFFFYDFSYLKKDVKSIARSLGLGRLADKCESMGICFVSPKNFHRFILDFVAPSPGPIRRLEPPHDTLGQHQGLHTLTVGQTVKGTDMQ